MVMMLWEGKVLSWPLRHSSWGISMLNLLFSALVLNAFHNNILQREERLTKITKKLSVMPSLFLYSSSCSQQTKLKVMMAF